MLMSSADPAPLFCGVAEQTSATKLANYHFIRESDLQRLIKKPLYSVFSVDEAGLRMIRLNIVSTFLNKIFHISLIVFGLTSDQRT